jgi:hypothetical protein
VSTDLARGTASIRLQLPSSVASAAARAVRIRLSAGGKTVHEGVARVEAGLGFATAQETIALAGLKLWSPEDPSLYELEVAEQDGIGGAAFNRRIGFREVRADGEKILLNGEPVYLRGALHWGYYPSSIIPRPSTETIREELRGLRELGFNTVKHCLWVPREEYFSLCDEMGFFTWLELPLWLPKVTPLLEQRMEREYPRILGQTAHHPSLVIASLGCELGADVNAAVLERLYRLARDVTGGILVRDNSGSGECYGGLAADFADFSDYHFYADLQNLEPLLESFTPRWKTRRPWLFGEYADADTWRVVGPNGPWWSRNDADQNPVSAVKPDFRLHLQQERLSAPGVHGRSGQIAALSLDHALLHRKLSVEFTRAFPQVGGYVITAIRDVPISTSGLFDDAGHPKFKAQDFRRFNADLVLFPRWDLARTWISGDRVLDADRFNQSAGSECALRVVASNFGPTLPSGTWAWRVVPEPVHGHGRPSGETPLAEGSGSLGPALARGDVRELTRISCVLPETNTPLGLVVETSLEHPAGRAENSWPLFVWPRPHDSPPWKIVLADPLGIFEPLREHYHAADFDPGTRTSTGGRGHIVLASSFEPGLREHVLRGGKALLVQRGRGFFPHTTVAFWREGITLFEQHPLTEELPAGPFRELQLFGMATDTSLRWIEAAGPVRAVKPVITRLDARESIASHYMAEVSFGEGRLIVSTLRFEGGMGRQPRSIAWSYAARWFLEKAVAFLAAS